MMAPHFPLKTLIGPGETRRSRTLSFSLLLPTKFLTFQIALFKHIQTYESTKFLSIITQLYYLHPISGFVSTLQKCGSDKAENVWHDSYFP